MGDCIKDIKEKTAGMDRKETVSYILTYYWYHILGTVFAIALILIFAGHYLFGNQKPVFTCIIVNQKTDDARDRRIADSFAERAGLPKERVVIDSGYHFSYDQRKLEGVNESSYEKFFFQWGNNEIDAVILTEDFYRHCKNMGGKFREITKEEAEGFTEYTDDGVCTAIMIGKDHFAEKVNGIEDEKLLLAFPSTGKHLKESDQFLEYLREAVEEGMSLEEIID